MGAAVRGVDVVGKAEHQLVIGVVVLHGDFRCGVVVRRRAGEMDDEMCIRDSLGTYRDSPGPSRSRRMRPSSQTESIA